MRLSNKVAIITGAAGGIGRATAVLFAREGAHIIAADTNDAAGEETVSEVRSAGQEGFFVHTDVSNDSDVKGLIETTIEKFNRVDILFNNAGILMRPAKIEETEESVWDRVLSINTKGIFLATKHVVPFMKKVKEGVIINTASQAGTRPVIPFCSPYAASKGAVIALTKALAIELAEDNIRVNCISPGATNTNILMVPENVNRQEFLAEMGKSVPLGRINSPLDIAYGALYLASGEASTLTGVNLNIDGGQGI